MLLAKLVSLLKLERRHFHVEDVTAKEESSKYLFSQWWSNIFSGMTIFLCKDRALTMLLAAKGLNFFYWNFQATWLRSVGFVDSGSLGGLILLFIVGGRWDWGLYAAKRELNLAGAWGGCESLAIVNSQFFSAWDAVEQGGNVWIKEGIRMCLFFIFVLFY